MEYTCQSVIVPLKKDVKRFMITLYKGKGAQKHVRSITRPRSQQCNLYLQRDVREHDHILRDRFQRQDVHF